MNACCEHFNRTLQESFVDYYENLLFADLTAFNRAWQNGWCFTAPNALTRLCDYNPRYNYSLHGTHNLECYGLVQVIDKSHEKP